MQYPDGRIKRDIFVDGGHDGFTTAQAHTLARTLIAAADECDQMTNHDG